MKTTRKVGSRLVAAFVAASTTLVLSGSSVAQISEATGATARDGCAASSARREISLARCLDRCDGDACENSCWAGFERALGGLGCAVDTNLLRRAYGDFDPETLECHARRRLAEQEIATCRSRCSYETGVADADCEQNCQQGYAQRMERLGGVDGCPVLEAIACSDGHEPPVHPTEAGGCAATSRPSIRGLVETPSGAIEADLEVVAGEAVFEGDIIVGKVDEVLAANRMKDLGSTQGVGRRLADYRWPGAVVPFVVDASLRDSMGQIDTRVTDAINHWMANTPLRFVPRVDEEDFINFRDGDDCSSWVGRQGGGQDVNLDATCSAGSAIHEIGHAIGLWHEQSRRDRLEHIDILWDNIQDGSEDNFQTYEQLDDDGVDLGTFDFGSIMMYGSYFFSADGDPTITKKDGSTFDAQRSALSSGDRSAADQLYRQGAVYVAKSNGKSEFIGTGKRWHDWFCVDGNTCEVGDVNGDKRDDLVSFEQNGEVWVALSRVKCGGFLASDCREFFDTPKRWHTAFCYGEEVCRVGDVTGDGKADIVTFTRGTTGDVYVARSTGKSFVGTGWKWHDAFAFGSEVPFLGDVNGDRKADVITFTRGTTGDVYVATSNGGSFVGTGWKWHDQFSFGSESPRVGDVNGDGKADVVTFTRGTSGDVYVATSTGASFAGTGWKWHDAFCFGSEIPRVGDVNGGGKADVITFTRGTTGDVYVATSNGGSFVGTGSMWHDGFSFGDEIPLVGHVNGDWDRAADVITLGR